MTPDALLALLAQLQDAFASLTARTPPTAKVPGLGGWPVRGLVTHLAGVHRWAAGMAVGDGSRSDELPVPSDADAAALASLYSAHAAELTATLSTVGPDGAALTLTGPGPAAFWFRRQVHETLVHLGDLVAAGSGTWTTDLLDDVVEIPAELWADGVDEIVTMFEPRQVRLGRIAPLARTVKLRASDTGTCWVLGAHEDGRRTAGGDEKAAAVVTGSAQALDLMLWGADRTRGGGRRRRRRCRRPGGGARCGHHPLSTVTHDGERGAAGAPAAALAASCRQACLP